MCIDYVENIIKSSKFKPDNILKVKEFVNKYIDRINYEYNLSNREKIIYLSGPVTNILDYKENFEDMENNAYKLYSMYRVYVVNPVKVLDLIDEYNFSYIDKIIICYCLLSICNIVIFDDRNDKYKSSIGTFSEVSYAIGKGIEVIDYTYILSLINQYKFNVDNFAICSLEKYMGISVKSDDDKIKKILIQYEKVDDTNEDEREILFMEFDFFGNPIIHYKGVYDDETERTNIDA